MYFPRAWKRLLVCFSSLLYKWLLFHFPKSCCKAEVARNREHDSIMWQFEWSGCCLTPFGSLSLCTTPSISLSSDGSFSQSWGPGHLISMAVFCVLYLEAGHSLGALSQPHRFSASHHNHRLAVVSHLKGSTGTLWLCMLSDKCVPVI